MTQTKKEDVAVVEEDPHDLDDVYISEGRRPTSSTFQTAANFLKSNLETGAWKRIRRRRVREGRESIFFFFIVKRFVAYFVIGRAF
jgi:hypothetical protein